MDPVDPAEGCGRYCGGCPRCREAIAATATTTGRPFRQVLELVKLAEAATLRRLEAEHRKETERAAGQRVASLAPGLGNRAIRRQKPDEPRPRKRAKR